MKKLLLLLSLLVAPMLCQGVDFDRKAEKDVPYKGWPVRRPMPADCWGVFKKPYGPGGPTKGPYSEYTYDPNEFDQRCWDDSLKKPRAFR